jgi:hypothetical protein
MTGAAMKIKPLASLHRTKIKKFFEATSLLKKHCKKIRAGYRQQQYDAMALALPMILELKGDDELERKFLKEIGATRHQSKKQINVATEYMVHVLEATSETMRKIAWKQARVIEFLHTERIESARIAAEIKARGGINAVLKQATVHDPRRKRAYLNKKGSKKKVAAPLTEKKNKNVGHENGAARSMERGRRNDRKMTMEVLINLSDRDSLLELTGDAKAKMTVKRDGADIVVVRVKKPPTETSSTEGSDEW